MWDYVSRGQVGFSGGSAVKNPAELQERQETQVRSLGWEDPLEEGTKTHFGILAWRIPMVKTIPVEKKCKKAKWLSGEALQIAVKRREAKSKGEKERYKHLNAEF